MELEKKEVRFQECNWLVKLWRYRWYVPIPFKWTWLIVRGFISPIKNNMTPKELYGIMIGEAQCSMKWYYTQEEVQEKIAIHRKNYEKLREDITSLISTSNTLIEITGDIIQIVNYPEYKVTDYKSVSIMEHSTDYLSSTIRARTHGELIKELGEHNVLTMDIPKDHSVAIYRKLHTERKHIDATIGLNYEGDIIALEDFQLHLDYGGMDTNFIHYFNNIFIELGDGTMIDVSQSGEIFNDEDTKLINEGLGKKHSLIIYIH